MRLIRCFSFGKVSNSRGMGVSGHVTGSEALILYGNFSIFFHNLLYYLCELPNL